MNAVNLKRLGGCKPKPPEFRFNASYRVDPITGCWMWLGRERGSNGYGAIKVAGRPVPAHRYSWQLHRGPIPDGMFVCHTCDTPKCVNPAHLFVGTSRDNMDDCKRKGRTRGGTKTPCRGENNVRSKLTTINVLMIRGDDRSQREIARDYGVSQALISSIKLQKVWRHI